jgi:hypothetical protein
LPKITLNPVDRGPPPRPGVMFAKLGGMLMSTLASAGLVYLLLTFSWEAPREPWDWQPQDIRVNFSPLLTTEEIADRFRKKREEWEAQNPLTQFPDANEGQDLPRANKSNGIESPFGNDVGDDLPPPPDYTGSGGVDGREMDRQKTEQELKIAENLKLEPVFRLLDETQNFVEAVKFEDASREKCMNEFVAFQGRQAPVNEQLALQVLRKLPKSVDAAYTAKIDKTGWFFGKSQQAADLYRGLGFAAEGRLFDLYEIKPAQSIVLQDGTKIESYFEGVVALLGPGLGRGEHKIEQRTVLFQCLALPDALKPYLNDKGHVSHDDKLVTEHVMVKLTGPYLRRWVYSREVGPFSSDARKVLTQDHLPLLLTADIATSDMPKYELTDELLQQVRDSLREDPAYLESEAAYYAMLARANSPDDAIEVVPEIGYFDLAGEETGPRYRGQGLRVVGMVGDNYAPVILPPNISGLRRVFRILVLHDTSNMETPKRYLVDMIEPPTNLEPRAIIDMEARYYRNVFEIESTTSAVRPLLVVRRIRPYSRSDNNDTWTYAFVGGIIVVTVMLAVIWFVFSDRRERAKFEARTLEHSRKRLEKQGGLKLKPLPGKGDAPPPDKPPDKE